MTGPCKHCPLSTLAIMHPGYSPHWGLDTGQWGPQTFPQLPGSKHFDWGQVAGQTLKTCSGAQSWSKHEHRYLEGARWSLSLQPRPTVMSAGWIYVSKWSPTWHFYFALQPSGWELLSNDLPGSPELSGLLRVGVFDSAGLQEDPWCLHDFWLAPWE